jgi:hypothetical protein
MYWDFGRRRDIGKTILRKLISDKIINGLKLKVLLNSEVVPLFLGLMSILTSLTMELRAISQASKL